MPRIVIRTDASTLIGTGHAMRCLALADEWRRQGGEAIFICRDLPGNLFGLIDEWGFAVLRLPEHGDLHDDANATRAAVGDMAPDWLIVDHYGLDARWERQMRDAARKLMVIDDLADRPHDCDLVLDQNLFPNRDTRYAQWVPSTCVQLTGPQYALLRPEFAAASAAARTRVNMQDGTVKRILVFFGGSDPSNETAKALQALQSLRRSDLAVDVVAGASNPRREEIERQCSVLPFVSFHCQAKNMAELMLDADLAIGAGGTASWERCCLGLPCIVVSVADNQDRVAQALADSGAVRFAGRSAAVSAQDLARALHELLNDAAVMRAMAEKALALVDGGGARRVVEALREPAARLQGSGAIALRYADADDECRMLEWRNAPDVRASSFDGRSISMEEHARWFRASLKNPVRHLLIGEVARQPIGVLRYDVAGEEAEVSIYLLSGVSGKGLGTRLLQEGNAWLRRNLPGVARVRARILPVNLASRKAFAKAGYVACGDDYLFDLVPDMEERK